MKLVLTCEHAGNEIPEEFLPLFREAVEQLNSHRGYDPGALDLFFSLKDLADFDLFQTQSRLLVELNRSLHHPQLFSEYTKQLPKTSKNAILEEYYFPYRREVEQQISDRLAQAEQVLHLSVHSFTPVLNGKTRDADIGLLYDPKREEEKEFCRRFKNALFEQDPQLRVRYNYPYLGTADGFTTYLRKKFRKNYCGIELEVNQKFVSENKMDKLLKNVIFKALQSELIG